MSGWSGYEGDSDDVAGLIDGPTLFGRTMWLVALTAGFFTLGAYLGRTLAYGLGLVFFLGALACLIAMRFAVRRSGGSAVGLLLAFGLLMGLATAPTLAYYASVNPQALWQAGAATALFMVGLGAAGYGSRRDLSALGRLSFWALVALVLFGVVLIFVQVPNGDVVYAILGLVVFAGLTMYDFQRLRRTRDLNSAPMMAASIFLDILNVFLFFLSLFDRRS